MSNVLALRAETAMPNLTESERRTYERACRLWQAAACHIREQPVIRPTLGANVTHKSRWEWLTS